jgi:RNA polymerase sigma-70 factor (ECF subfamily)
VHDETELADLMRSALAGCDADYRLFLDRVASKVRSLARRKLSGYRGADVEDIVQETLLAVHTKRHTWRTDRPIGPWIAAIARYKVVDEMRRRGSRVEVDIADLADLLAVPETEATATEAMVDRALGALPSGQRSVVSAITIEGRSVRETATLFGMTEVAVRVALHRGLATIRARIGGAL